jgi:hypothetical protein
MFLGLHPLSPRSPTAEPSKNQNCQDRQHYHDHHDNKDCLHAYRLLRADRLPPSSSVPEVVLYLTRVTP